MYSMHLVAFKEPLRELSGHNGDILKLLNHVITVVGREDAGGQHLAYWLCIVANTVVVCFKH